MKHLLVAACSLAILSSGCSTTGRQTDAATRTVIGSAAGAAIGAVAGGATGAGAFQGAALGAIAGGAVGALVPGRIVEGRQYYRDTRGYCYYVDKNGRPQYDGTVRC
jgi:uncharacterized protein YcfJ